MQAVTQSRFGGSDVLEITDIAKPTPLATEVLVAVRAAGVNPVDAAVRSGAFPILGPPPFILGWDLSGVVTDVVPGVNRSAVGDEVYGMPMFPRPAGAYAEFAAAPSRQLARKPRTLDHVHAAALPLAGLTAWQALVDVAGVQPGQRVLIHAAGGGVGHLAVQIAKHLGAEVTATASASKHRFVRDLGADHVIDYHKVDFTEQVRDMDVVLELVGGDYGTRSTPCSARAGFWSPPSSAPTPPSPTGPSPPVADSPASPWNPTAPSSNTSHNSSTTASSACTSNTRSRCGTPEKPTLCSPPRHLERPSSRCSRAGCRSGLPRERSDGGRCGSGRAGWRRELGRPSRAR